MQAVRLHQHGSADVLQLEPVPDPHPGPGEVVVRVRACALNHLDLWVRTGIPGQKIPLPHILGSDIAGEIAEVGESVTWLRPGEKVVLCPSKSCGHCEHCLAGDDNLCPEYTVIGYVPDGGYAEFVRAPAVNARPLPADLDFISGAAVPLVFMTAWHMLVARAGIRPGQNVLVLAAASGVGSAAIQIARLFHCRVLTTAGDERKAELARGLGADHVIDHYRQNISAEVRRLCPDGVDIVVEHVGEATWDHSVRALRRGGALVTCGATSGYAAHLDLRFLFARQLRILGSYMAGRVELDQVLKLVSAGDLHPVVDRVFPLAEAAEAHRYLESRRQFGKIVLAVA
jgi:NADPH:quinone reductase-like Zn-dependent oxidoreductase